MNVHAKRKAGGETGFTLIECVAYLGLVVVVLGGAVSIFFHSWDESKSFRRNADDVLRAMHTGEQWRADMRAATGSVQLTDANGVEQIRIPGGNGDVVYTFSDGELRRQAGGGPNNELWLSRVKSSRMLSETRQDVAAWRWEIELDSVAGKRVMRPLFTFEAVAGGGVNR